MAEPKYSPMSPEPQSTDPKKIGIYVAGGCGVLYALLVGVITYKVVTGIATIQTDWQQPQFDAEHNLRTPANVTMYEWWPTTSSQSEPPTPECDRSEEDRLSVPWTKDLLDSCGKDCFSSELPVAVDAFFSKREKEIEMVSFLSRGGESGQYTVRLYAWWMPAEDPKAEIIVLTHGMSGSNIAVRVLLPAFLLQKLGYAVLLPDLRDHGLSSKSDKPDKESWGAEYHLDVLGAWDWAVKRKAGGDSKKVGLMGNSMGGFVSAIAAGLESRVPALFLDGAVYDPYTDLVNDCGVGGLPSFLPFLLQAVTWPGWWLAEKIVGIPLRHQLPEKTIPTRTSKLQVGMVYGKEDLLVAGAKRRYTDLFANNPDAAERTVTYWPEGSCNGNAHVLTSIQYPDEYQKKLDSFWSCAFKGTKCPAKSGETRHQAKSASRNNQAKSEKSGHQAKSGESSHQAKPEESDHQAKSEEEAQTKKTERRLSDQFV